MTFIWPPFSHHVTNRSGHKQTKPHAVKDAKELQVEYTVLFTLLISNNAIGHTAY